MLLASINFSNSSSMRQKLQGTDSDAAPPAIANITGHGSSSSVPFADTESTHFISSALSVFILLIVIVAIWVKFGKKIQEFLYTQFGIGKPVTISNNVVDGTTGTNQANGEQKSTTISIKSSEMSIGVFLLCFFLPFLSPLIALFRGQFLLLLGILILWLISGLLLFIPILGLFVAVILNIVIAVMVAKSKKETQIKVAQQ